MKLAVIANHANKQVSTPVVSNVTVDVMDALTTFETTAQYPLRYRNMLIEQTTVSCGARVQLGLAAAETP